jgi:hypothetical protein
MRSFAKFPDSVLPEWRKKRSYISSILSKNEVDRDDRYNRKIFRRVCRGRYMLNPDLEIKLNENWMSIRTLKEMSL